jgi:hypothetical protein
MLTSLMLGSVDALNPQPEQVNVGDMLYSLSRIIRWNGGGRLSVLQHMAHVARILERGGADRPTILAGLVHDLHEYVTGDIPAPLLPGLWLDTGAELVRVTDTQKHIQTAIERRLSIDLTGADFEAVDAADKKARDMEQDAMQGAGWPPWMEQIVDRDADAVVRLYRRGLEQLGVTL